MTGLIRGPHLRRHRHCWRPVDCAGDRGWRPFLRWRPGASRADQERRRRRLTPITRRSTIFRSILKERRAQIDQRQPLPDLPGQAIYLARNNMISAYKDLTDLLPARIGKPNRFGLPSAYFDAANEPLLDEYFALFSVMQAPPAQCAESDTPFNDVVDLATDIARAKGLDAAHADVAARISMGIFFAETGGLQNMGNARSKSTRAASRPAHRRTATARRNGRRSSRRSRRSIQPDRTR